MKMPTGKASMALMKRARPDGCEEFDWNDGDWGEIDTIDGIQSGCVLTME
jgi:hypothetical protein